MDETNKDLNQEKVKRIKTAKEIETDQDLDVWIYDVYSITEIIELLLANTEAGLTNTEAFDEAQKNPNMLNVKSQQYFKECMENLFKKGKLIKEGDKYLIKERPLKRIILGTREIFVYGLQWDHIAVGVGEMDDVEIPVKWPLFWFEVYDKGEKHGYICLNNGCPCIRTGPGQPDFGIKSRTGTIAQECVGTTRKTLLQIQYYNLLYCQNNETYTPKFSDCVVYATSLIKWMLCSPNHIPYENNDVEKFKRIVDQRLGKMTPKSKEAFDETLKLIWSDFKDHIKLLELNVDETRV